MANTTAASVEDTVAASRMAVRTSKPNRRTPKVAATATEIMTPAVARRPERTATGRRSAQRVVNPPSVRRTATAMRARLKASWVSSKRTPRPDSPRISPMPR